MSQAAFTLPAFAKINWALHVLGRRADNYHELRTIFQTITLQDTLSFSLRSDQSLHLACDAPDIPVDERNLIYRAAIALQKRYHIKKGASIDLRKRVPAAGGLGGGSSDAAIALLGLAHLWQIKTSVPELENIGAELGADIPFFFTGGTALGAGLGTEISPLRDEIEARLLIVTPNVKVSTAEAYKSLNAPALTKIEGDIMLSISRAHAQFPNSLPDVMHNDFERVIFRLEPEIERARNALLRAGARHALLAGSGSSIFGIFDNVEAQERAARALDEESNWRIFSCATLGRADYFKALGRCAALLERALT